MKRVVIHQPDFMPWLGYFHRLAKADLVIDLDHVQFVNGTSRSWMHRDLIKTRAGAKWLSLRIQKAPLGTPICDILLSTDPAWRGAHLNLLLENYRKATFFKEIFGQIESIYKSSHASLVEINLASLNTLGSLLDTVIPRCSSSAMQPLGAGNVMLIDLLKKVEATHYISGLGAKAYLDPLLFEEAGLEVIWQEFSHPIYEQLHGDFIPNLSAIDMLFNCGVERSRSLLRQSFQE